MVALHPRKEQEKNAAPAREIVSHSVEETHAFARELLARLRPGDVLALHGDLGAGKTTFVQGLARAMGVSQAVNSPTFTLINEYPGPLPLYHVDLYRIRGPQDALSLGIDEYLHGRGITAIEWAERIQDLLPGRTLNLFFRAGSQPDERIICVREGGRP